MRQLVAGLLQAVLGLLFLSFIVSAIVSTPNSLANAQEHPQQSESPQIDTSALISRSAEGAEVYFISPLDGETVGESFRVRFGLANMGVAPAGVIFDNSGHHHLLINVNELPDMRLPIPADEQHVHFGLGQTEAEINLPAGEHRLQLLLGNHLHIPHDPPVISEVITVRVK